MCQGKHIPAWFPRPDYFPHLSPAPLHSLFSMLTLSLNSQFVSLAEADNVLAEVAHRLSILKSALSLPMNSLSAGLAGERRIFD
jgi:hypothetical protein